VYDMRAHRRGPQTDTRHGGCCCWSACGPAPQATAVSQLCAPTVRAACRVRVAAPGRLRSGHRTPAQLSGGPAFAPTDQASREWEAYPAVEAPGAWAQLEDPGTVKMLGGVLQRLSGGGKRAKL